MEMPKAMSHSGDRVALRHLLAALRQQGSIPAAPAVERTEHERVVDVFAAYLTRLSLPWPGGVQ